MSFTVETAGLGTSGSGTAASPISIEPGGMLNMSISQESRYTDPDGNVHTCKPVATIKLHAVADTVAASDLQTLLTLRGTPDVKTTTEGSNPRRSTTVQTFAVGGQEIVFNLSHEVYTVVNSASKTVEMPYLKPGEATFGAPNASETRTGMSLSAISVRPLSLTRAETFTDSAAYEIDIRFSLQLEGVHTTAEQQTPLNFSVKYVGIVETVTELIDPFAGLTWSWRNKDGATIAAPFEWNAHSAQPLELHLSQEAVYTNMFSHTMTGAPTAQLTLTATKDTVWVSSTDELEQRGILAESAVTTTGESPAQHTKTCTYIVNGQTLTFCLGWQSGCTLADADIGEQITMPNAKFGELTVKDIAVAKRSDEELEKRGLSLHAVTTTFTLELVSEGLAEEKRETVDIAVTHLAVIEPKLVKVTYKRGWEWVEPHDNMMLLYYARVYRTRHYSNGESYTDTFGDTGHPAHVGFDWPVNPEPIKSGEGEIYFVDGKPAEVENIADSIYNITLTKVITAPADDKFSVEITWIDKFWGWGEEGKVGNWEYYHPSSRSFDEQCLVLGDDVVLEGDIGTPIPSDMKDRNSGWYMGVFGYVCLYGFDVMLHRGNRKSVALFTSTSLYDERYDQFLLLDGRMFTFLDKSIRPDPEFNGWVEEVPGGWKSYHEMKMQYMGRNFRATIRIDYLINP